MIVDTRVAAALSCVNTEPKNVLFLCFDAAEKTLVDLMEDFASLAGESFVTRTNIRDYLTHSILPAGLARVKKRPVRYPQEPANYYTLTQEGVVARPLAAFTLKWAIDHETSAYSLLGPTAGNSNYIRFRILEELEDGLGQTEIERRVGLRYDGARKPLLSLAKQGLIGYEPFGESRNMTTGCFQGARVTLTPLMRERIDEYVLPVRAFVSAAQGPMLDMLHTPDLWQTYARKGMDLYEEIAPHINALGVDGWAPRILAVLGEEEKRPMDVIRALDVQEGTGRKHLEELARRGVLQKRKDSTGIFYSVG